MAKNDSDMRGDNKDNKDKNVWESNNKQQNVDTDKNKNKSGNEWERNSSINQQTSNFTGGQK